MKYALLKALEDRERPVEFFEMREVPGSYSLKKRPFYDADELLALLPRRSLSLFEEFEALED